MARKTLTTSRRAAIWRAHECRCIYCTELITFADLDIDHIVPLRLKDKPLELSKLKKEYGLNDDFDFDNLLNLVPAHRYCNLQKKGRILSKNRALHFLSIAEEKYKKAEKNEFELKQQVKKDKVLVMLQVAVGEGLISQNELIAIINSCLESQNNFEILANLPFVDSDLKGFITDTDIELLYDRPILPREYGLEKLTMVKLKSRNGEEIEARTCREWAEAVYDGYYAKTTYDIKEEIYFKQVYALVVSLAKANTPKISYITNQKVNISNFELLPVTLLPVLSGDSVEELRRFKSNGVGITDLISQGKAKMVSSTPLSLTLEYNHMRLNLVEILRADLNDDGIEDLLVRSYKWTTEGTFGAGQILVLTRLGIDQPFIIADDVELEVHQQLLDNKQIHPTQKMRG